MDFLEIALFIAFIVYILIAAWAWSEGDICGEIWYMGVAIIYITAMFGIGGIV